MIDFLVGLLGGLMRFCYEAFRNYGFAIIAFTFVTKIILFPINIWTQKNSVKMIKLQPEVNMIAARYAGNRDKIGEEQLKLYKRENYKPALSVLPLLIQIPLILGVISVVYAPLTHILKLDAQTVEAFAQKTQELLNVENLGGARELKILEVIKNGSAQLFSTLNAENAGDAVNSVLSLDMNFLGFDLSVIPSLASFDMYLLIPVLSGLSSFLLSFEQNRINVLQKETKGLSKWGVAIFLVAFSVYFTFIVPAGVGLYWIAGNLIGILSLYLVNVIYPPRKYIDYEALEKSKTALEKSRELAKSTKVTPEQKKQAKEDYKRFCDENNKKQIVFYSEKSGFYKYFEGLINELLATSDVVMHYVTSDPNDVIFKKNEPRIIPYYIDDNHLIPLFMKVDADIMIMTMPDINKYHLKRSIVRKDVEYIYVFHGIGSVNTELRTGALDHYDTIYLTNEQVKREIRALENEYGTQEKRLVEYGHPLLDDMLRAYENSKKTEKNNEKRIMIAPSWQEDNMMESCIDNVLDELLSLGEGYNIVLRPHPQYLRHNAAEVARLREKYASFDKRFIVEDDFSSSESVYSADLMITDWSSIAYEYCFTTCKPVLFIHTPMKIMNPEYKRINIVSFAERLRNIVGCDIALSELEKVSTTAKTLIDESEAYKEKIERIRQEERYNFGCAASVGAKDILERLELKKK